MIEEITLRDYMAIHSTQPGASEIVEMAGLFYRKNKVCDAHETILGTFNEWYESIGLNEALDLCSRVKYAQADSMLRVRSEKL